MVISEVKAAVDLTKDIISAIKAAQNYDPSILESLDKLREKILDAQAAEMEFREKITEMEKELALKDMDYDPDSGVSFDPSDTEKKRQLCTRCLEEKKIKSSLRIESTASHCRICQEWYQSGAQKRAEEIQQSQNDELANARFRNAGWP